MSIFQRVSDCGPCQPSVSPVVVWSGPESATRRVRIKLTKDQYDLIWKRRSRAHRLKWMYVFAEDRCLVAPQGRCECRICNADGDCCGSMVPSTVKVVPQGGRSFVIEQSYYRNV